MNPNAAVIGRPDASIVEERAANCDAETLLSIIFTISLSYREYMRTLMIASIIAIVSASVLLGISKINLFAPSASAFIVVSKGGAIAGTHESSAGKPIAIAPHKGSFGPTEAASGCGGKPATLTPSNGLACTP
jgi:hypothetical protein